MSGHKAICEWCDASFEKPRPSSAARFCSREHYLEWWRENVQQRASANGTRVLAELHAEGRDPRHTEKAQASRSRKVAKNNRENPRLAKLSPERRSEIARRASEASRRTAG